MQIKKYNKQTWYFLVFSKLLFVKDIVVSSWNYTKPKDPLHVVIETLRIDSISSSEPFLPREAAMLARS